MEAALKPTRTVSHPRSPVGEVARPVAAALVALFAFSAIFVEAFHAPRPHGLGIGFVGGAARASRIQRVLDAQAPGGFHVRGYADEAVGRHAVVHADVRAVFIPGASGDRLLVAAASGSTQLVTESFHALAARTNTPLAVSDVAPLPAHDRLGLSSVFAVLGTLIPSLAFGALLASLARGASSRLRWTAVGGYAVLAGIVIALNVDVLIGALTGAFAGVAFVAGLLALAVAATVHGLTRLAGPAGLVTAVALLLLLGFPSSGGAVTPQLQPSFYGAISAWLPAGAALTAFRHVVYFDWAHTATPLLVLAAWAAGGLAIGLLPTGASWAGIGRCAWHRSAPDPGPGVSGRSMRWARENTASAPSNTEGGAARSASRASPTGWPYATRCARSSCSCSAYTRSTRPPAASPPAAAAWRSGTPTTSSRSSARSTSMSRRACSGAPSTSPCSSPRSASPTSPSTS